MIKTITLSDAKYLNPTIVALRGNDATISVDGLVLTVECTQEAWDFMKLDDATCIAFASIV